MPNPYFQFKQFTVHHDRCAMKVGTDGVLLGAWAPLPQQDKIKVLDVGTGTGLVALMLAQRLAKTEGANCSKSVLCADKDSLNESSLTFIVDAIEIDVDSSNQAAENISDSIWCKNIRIVNKDFVTWSKEQVCQTNKYDVIVSNPPYFQNSLKNNTAQLSQARHTDSLSFWELASGIKSLLSQQGTSVIILPTTEAEVFETEAKKLDLVPQQKLLVRTKPDGPIRRVLTQYVHKNAFYAEEYKENALLTEVARHQYSDEFKELTRDFYLDK